MATPRHSPPEVNRQLTASITDPSHLRHRPNGRGLRSAPTLQVGAELKRPLGNIQRPPGLKISLSKIQSAPIQRDLHGERRPTIQNCCSIEETSMPLQTKHRSRALVVRVAVHLYNCACFSSLYSNAAPSATKQRPAPKTQMRKRESLPMGTSEPSVAPSRLKFIEQRGATHVRVTGCTAPFTLHSASVRFLRFLSWEHVTEKHLLRLGEVHGRRDGVEAHPLACGQERLVAPTALISVRTHSRTAG